MRSHVSITLINFREMMGVSFFLKKFGMGALLG